VEDTAKLIAQQTARSLIYRRLADAFRLPESGLAKILEELKTALADLGSEAVDLIESYHGDTDLEALRLDHTALFVGPFLSPAPPYGSIYLEEERRLMGDSTEDARKHYLSLGLDLSDDFKEAPDHIAAELEFMYVLIRHSLHAIETADHELLTELVRHQDVFLQNHLGQWIPPFTDKMIEYSRTDFYRSLAMMTRSFVAEDRKAVQEAAALLYETQNPAQVFT
jgi:TorA maturation chaperone TorD